MTRTCSSGRSRRSRSSSDSTGVIARRMSPIGSASGEDRIASALIRDSPSWPFRPEARRRRSGCGRALEDLAQDPFLDARDAPDLAERLVAAERVVDLADGRHHGLDEADPTRTTS